MCKAATVCGNNNGKSQQRRERQRQSWRRYSRSRMKFQLMLLVSGC